MSENACLVECRDSLESLKTRLYSHSLKYVVAFDDVLIDATVAREDKGVVLYLRFKYDWMFRGRVMSAFGCDTSWPSVKLVSDGRVPVEKVFLEGDSFGKRKPPVGLFLLKNVFF